LDPTRGLFFERVLSDRRRFYSFLTMQLVDSLFSLFQPRGWALEVASRRQLLQQLTPLRNALAQVVPLTEAVSKCILSQLPCQKWWKAQNGNWFVSSVDPSSWQSYLERGHVVAPPTGKLSCSLYIVPIGLCLPMCCRYPILETRTSMAAC